MPAIFLGQTFGSAEHLLAAKKCYEAEQLIQYVVKNSTSAMGYNQHYQLNEENKIPEGMKWRDITFVCKKYGDVHCAMNPTERTYRTERCPSQFIVKYDLHERLLKVIRVIENHCH